MSYLALARKWRPKTFSQLIGQEHVSKGLMNALNHKRLHHAYLFTGTRGVGKTSVARLLAKCLNCEVDISAEPCLQCEHCLAIEQGHFTDLIEVDAASKTGVEDTRALLDNVQYQPSSGRFKIYLIDEVHMLSQHSFNALLKTLEEPPAHVKFLLATTDPQKLPATILSRCLQFNLRHLAPEVISQHLQHILHEEQIPFETNALDVIAEAARGSMRDSLSILDQAINACDEAVNASDVKQMLGYTQKAYALDIVESIAAKQADKLFNICQSIAAEGGHFHYVLNQLMACLHRAAVYQILDTHHADGILSLDKESRMVASLFSAEDIQLFYQIAAKGAEEMQLAPTLAIGFEMTLIRMLAFRPAPKIEQANSFCSGSEAKTPEPITMDDIATTVPQTTPSPPIAQPEQEERTLPHKTLKEPDTDAALLTSQPQPLKALAEWKDILPQLKLRGLALNAAENAAILSKEDGLIRFSIEKSYHSLFTASVIQRIETALSHYFQEKIKIQLDNSNTAETSTPAQEKQQLHEISLKNANDALEADPVLESLKDKFSVKIVKNSINTIEDDI